MNPLGGLVLSGGRSRRMGEQKELLCYRGITEAERMYRMLEELTTRAFYSLRSEQEAWPMFAHGKRIVDSIPDGGPLAALCTAFVRHPGLSWLVVSVDMPLLEYQDLHSLITARREGRGVVAYETAANRIEPMPAIYEYSMAEAAGEMIRRGKCAMRGLCDAAQSVQLKPGDEKHLMNINTALHRDQIMNGQ